MEVFWLFFSLFWFICEIFSKRYMGIWFGAAAAVTMVISFFMPLWYIQIPIFIVLSTLLYTAFRNLWKKDKDAAHRNEMIESLVGKDAIVIKRIHSSHRKGKINVFGQEIDAVSKGVISEGEVVKIIRFKGNIAVVKKSE